MPKVCHTAKEGYEKIMNQEFHVTSDANNTTQPAVVFGIGIIPPDNQRQELGVAVAARREQLPLDRTLQDNEQGTLLLPVGRLYGTYEELRERIHKQVDMLFDAHMEIGDFAPKI